MSLSCLVSQVPALALCAISKIVMLVVPARVSNIAVLTSLRRWDMLIDLLLMFT